MRIAYILRNERGAILVLMAALLVVLIGMAALSLDVGQMYIARQRAQNVCDAAALAGAWSINPGDTTSQSAATQDANDCALGNNEDSSWKIYKTGSTAEGVTVTFPEAGTVKAEGDVPVEFLFAGIFGKSGKRVHASAVAKREMSQHITSPDIVPIGVSDTVVNDLSFGEQQVLKSDQWQPGATGTYIGAGNFAPVSLPGDSGGNDYRQRLAGTATDDVQLSVGDFLDTKPGNMVGPTAMGLDTRVSSDTTYTNDATAWDQWSQTWNPTSLTCDDTPRLVIVPIIKDPEGTVNGQSEPVEVVGFAAFFIESSVEVRIDQDGTKTEYAQITGRFVTAAIGQDAMQILWWMGGGSNGTLYDPRLVQ